MEPETLFNERPGECGRDPFWVLALLFGAIILLSHGLEQARGLGWTSKWFGDSWEYVYYIVRDSGDLAFASLIVLVIWFGRNRNWVFATVLLLGGLNWFENELISHTFFGGFIRTIDWWEWESIDSAMTVVLTIAAMPVVRWLTRSKRVFTVSVSIADIMLLTMASAVLIVASNHIASLPMTIGTRGEPVPHFVPFIGWDPTIEHLVASGLLAVIAIVIVYVAYFGRLIWGFAAYVCSWVLYLGAVKLVDVVKFKPNLAKQNLGFDKLWHGEYDHYVVVFTLFLLCILIARLTSRYWSGSSIEGATNQAQE